MSQRGTLYTFGYQSGALPQAIAMVLAGNCKLFDIRMVAYSPNPMYSASAIKAKVGAAYEHLKALGNVNYKNGGPIKFLDESFGIGKLVETLDAGPDALIMCGCKELATCHRNAVAEKMAALGYEVKHLSAVALVAKSDPCLFKSVC